MYRILVISTLMIGLTFGCSDSSTDTEPPELTPSQVAGEYTSTTFEVQTDDELTDVSTVGGFINVTLNSDLTTNGQIFIPDTLCLTEGGETDEDLTGTFSISEHTLTFQHDADTFIRDAKWIYDNGQLTTTDFATVTLQKQ